MNTEPVIAIFDVGKTNKKLFLFDENYKIVFEKSARFTETVDEDGFPCENLQSLKQSVFDSLNEVQKLKQFEIKAVNFSAYGASFVYLNKNGEAIAPLYNYLKPYPELLSKAFYKTYGGQEDFSIQTASPVLGSLNSGLQLYRVKNERPSIFKQIKHALHLPQYLSFLLSGNPCSEMTSIGCHTAMWDFNKNQYHRWIANEGIAPILPPIIGADKTLPAQNGDYKVGVGLHDSSAALIPYLVNFTEPFILISTGTWCISLNPFNQSPLRADELQDDCLNYLQHEGKPVKASRLFSGSEHEQQVKRISVHFKQDVIKYRNIAFDAGIISHLKANHAQAANNRAFAKESTFGSRNLADFKNDNEAYHQLIMDLVDIQVASTNLVLRNTGVRRIFVDGGFGKNSVFMNLLAIAYPYLEVFAASMAQASAVGAALSIHNDWNTKAIPRDIIQLKYYSAKQNAVL